MSGEALVSKLAMLAKYAVLPGVMAAAVIYSPPDFLIPKPKPKPSSSSSSSSQVCLSYNNALSYLILLLGISIPLFLCYLYSFAYCQFAGWLFWSSVCDIIFLCLRYHVILSLFRLLNPEFSCKYTDNVKVNCVLLNPQSDTQCGQLQLKCFCFSFCIFMVPLM